MMANFDSKYWEKFVTLAKFNTSDNEHIRLPKHLRNNSRRLSTKEIRFWIVVNCNIDPRTESQYS